MSVSPCERFLLIVKCVCNVSLNEVNIRIDYVNVLLANINW